jgi:hypothetical protein
LTRVRDETRQRRVGCWLAANELDLLNSSGGGFLERLRPAISGDRPVA